MTIQELSQELNISAQALRQWCKRNGVRKESETKGKKAGYFLTENDVEQIRQHYSRKGNERKETAKGNESGEKGKESNESKLFDILQKELDTLREQLAEKDKTIESLLKRLDEQTAIANKFEERLQSEQILHAGTIKLLQDKRPEQAQSETEKEPEPEQAQIDKLTKQVQELKEKIEKERPAAASETSRTTSKPRPAQRQRPEPPKKKSLFERLFGRK